MLSVGPYELTWAEVFGLKFLRQEEERQLRKTSLQALRSGRATHEVGTYTVVLI
jgi:hypothetical protein